MATPDSKQPCVKDGSRQRRFCVVLDQDDLEKVLVAVSLAGKGLSRGYHTWLLLVGNGTRCEELHGPEFPIRPVLAAFVEEGGELRACGGSRAAGQGRPLSLARGLKAEDFGRLL